MSEYSIQLASTRLVYSPYLMQRRHHYTDLQPLASQLSESATVKPVISSSDLLLPFCIQKYIYPRVSNSSETRGTQLTTWL